MKTIDSNKSKLKTTYISILIPLAVAINQNARSFAAHELVISRLSRVKAGLQDDPPLRGQRHAVYPR